MRFAIRTTHLLLAIALLAASPLAAQDGDYGVRASSRNSVSSNRGTALSENRGNAIAPSNTGTPLGGNLGSGVRPSSANAETPVTGNRGEAVSENRGSVEVDYADYDGGCCYGERPGAGAGTAAEIGSVVNAVPANCVPVEVDGQTYEQCDSTFYQPSFNGTSTGYTVAAPPY